MSRYFVLTLAVGLSLVLVPDDASAQRRQGFQQPQEQDEENQAPRGPAQGRRGGMRGGAQAGQPEGRPGMGRGMQQGPAGGRGGHGHGGAVQPSPLFMALDRNGDGQLSAEELSSARSAMSKLDKDNDGILSLAECAPAGGGHGHGLGGNPEQEAQQNVETLMAFDKNDDGVLTAEELPERMQNVIERSDSDGDGKITRQELTQTAQREGTQPQPFGRRGGGRGRIGQQQPSQQQQQRPRRPQ